MTDPACPGCGMTAQVAPSRKHLGLFMCHGCAQYFAPSDVERVAREDRAAEVRLRGEERVAELEKEASRGS